MTTSVTSLIQLAVETFRLKLAQGNPTPSFDECLLSAFQVYEPDWFTTPVADDATISDPHSGLKPDEEEIMSLLVKAWAQFLALEPGADDTNEFRIAINRCQSLVGAQVLKRHFPSYWR